MANRKTFHVLNQFDVVQVRQWARQMAREMGFGLTDQTRIATAVSEMARQVLGGQRSGQVLFSTVRAGTRWGMECTCLGDESLMTVTDRPRGQILGGVERLVDEFEVDPGDGVEVAVVMRKWL